MEIKAEVKQEIRNFILGKNLAETLKVLPEKGTYTVEYEYELAENKKVNDYIFVVSQKMTYHNHSLSAKRYGLYAFDVESGKEIKDFEKTEGCYVGFFNDLTIIEKII